MNRFIASIAPIVTALALAGCSSVGIGTGSPEQTQTPTNESSTPDLTDVESAFNAAVRVAVEDAAPGVVALNESVTVTGAVVSFEGLEVRMAPLGFDGRATVSLASGEAEIYFTGTTQGQAWAGADALGQISAQLPVTQAFAQAMATAISDACQNAGVDPATAAVAASAAAGGDCDFELVDNGNGTFTFKGSCDVGGVTVDVEIDIDPANGTVAGKIVIDDGVDVIEILI